MNKTLTLALLGGISAASAQINPIDTNFLAKAVRGNNYEIEAAKLALRRSNAPAVREYAQMMINQHTRLGQDVKAAVRRAGSMMALPVTVTYSQADMLKALRDATRGNFNNVYRQQMIASHEQTLALFKTYANSRYSNLQLRRVVQAAIPTVQMHLKHAYNLPR